MTLTRPLFLGSLAWISIGLSAVAVQPNNDNQPTMDEIPQWPYPVVYDKAHEKDLKPRAVALRKLLKAPELGPGWGETNPVCCFWLTINHFTPNPGQAGYVIVIQPGGAYISAANVEQMDAAIKRIAEVGVEKDGQLQLPVGLLTNYKLATAIKPSR